MTLEEMTAKLYIQYLTHGDWAFEKEEAYKKALKEARYFQRRMQKTRARIADKFPPIEMPEPVKKIESRRRG